MHSTEYSGTENWKKYTKLIKIPLYWCCIFHAKDADRVFACGHYTSSFYVMETSKNTSTNLKVYIALKCKRAEPQSPSHQKSLISDWYFTHSKSKHMIQKLFVRDVRSAIVVMFLLENEMQGFRKLLSYFLNCIGLDALCILAQSLFKFTNFGTQV